MTKEERILIGLILLDEAIEKQKLKEDLKNSKESQDYWFKEYNRVKEEKSEK